jgi:rhamnosyltransferase subunit A
MKLGSDVISVCGKYRIYYEHYKREGAVQTAIMVNGALATTVSFSQTIRNLNGHVNVVLFDLPFAGQSRRHNAGNGILTKEDEVEILLDLIDRFQVAYLVSASWGGVSALLSLARRPPTIEKAVILSFSPVINPAMHDYMTNAQGLLQRRDIHGAAELLNNTVGRYLPRLLKSHNHQYLLRMVEGNEQQIMFHIDQIFSLDQNRYVDIFQSIEIPVLFINGALDQYTTTKDVRVLARHIKYAEFATIPNAGHFLDLESTEARRVAGEVKREFLFRRLHLDHSLEEATNRDRGAAVAV